MASLPLVLPWRVQPADAQPLALWDAASLAAATGGSASGPFQVSGVEIDSRDVLEGDLFFALKGETTDGHRFLDKAFSKGAAAAVVDRPIKQPHVLVKNTSSALELLAKTARERGDATVIGVTGSVGKTGV
jgi:UDP-N-acetylmuramoyl-tripeptide--D-alanyl-D-alanine ligase